MPDVLTEAARRLIARPVLATLATISSSGGPQTTPLWIDLDGDDLVINTAQGRAKARNLERNPQVSLCIIDPDDPFNVVAVNGTVVEITNNGADAHIDSLAKKYMGVDTYPMRTEGEVRLKVKIRTDRITMQSAD